MTAIYFHNDPVYIYINIISHKNLQFVWDAYGCVVVFYIYLYVCTNSGHTNTW